jgi:uncharacterized membrane protein (DUF485 family)
MKGAPALSEPPAAEPPAPEPSAPPPTEPPRQSLAVGGTSDGDRDHVRQGGRSDAAAHDAVHAERSGAYAASLAGWCGQLAVALLAITAAVWPPEGQKPWPLSSIVISLLLCAGTVLALVLVVEHEAWRLFVEGEKRAARWALYPYRTLTFILVAAALAVSWIGHDADPSWIDAVEVEVVLLLVSGLVLARTAHAYALLLRPRFPRRVGEAPVRERGPGVKPVKQRKILAIGASGGGIRAASFVLGGHQAFQARASALKIARPADEPHVFAVSGGSYIAAALAMRRSFEGGSGRTKDMPTPWTEAYTPPSVELERLRRHTRYLFEPRGRAWDGVLTLAVGALVNLFVAGSALIALTWLSAHIAKSLGFVDEHRGEDGFVDDFWVRVPHHGLTLWPVPLALLFLLLALTLAGWYGGSRYDNATVAATDVEDRARSRTSSRLVEASNRRRAPLLLAGLAWLVLAIGLPGASTGVAHLATHNQPTATVARGIAALDLATQQMCSHAFAQNLKGTAAEVEAAAEANPGAERSAKTGACGAEIEVTRGTGQDAPEAPSSAQVTQLERFANLDDGNLAGRIVGIAGLLLSVLGLLRRGPAPGGSETKTKRFAALRRRLLTILPLTVFGLLTLYLALLWFRWLATEVHGEHLRVATVVAVVACAIAFLIDANVTSMHGYYRARLADAFAVGVQGNDARQLPEEVVYRFSDLPGPEIAERERQKVQPVGGDVALDDEVVNTQKVPARLHIVATLNTQAHNESPTMRGGFPLVFGAEHVRVFREEGITIERSMRSFENFAGPRRLSIMSTVAISGAAVSPLMGRYAEQMAPYRFLLAMFNIRLGTWVRNPAHTPDDAKPMRRSNILWMTTKPGLAQMALEAAGSSSAHRRWVYLSDGGHLDNTGMVEAVRHVVRGGRAGRVVILDASNDADGSWQAVGDAVAVVRADLDLDLRRQPVAECPPWMRLYSAFTGATPLVEVLVVKAVRVEPLEKKDGVDAGRDWWAELPPDVQSFQARHADFPRASTSRQKFGDLEFEAYRALGFSTVVEAVKLLGWDA